MNIKEDEVRAAISTLHPNGELFEIRLISGKWNASGYFTDVKNALQQLRRYANRANTNVYITLNSINPACYSRNQRNNFIERASPQTSDNDITSYEWLMIDLDPKRTTGVSSTEMELQQARELSDKVYSYLLESGWNPPVIAMSGNGIHLLYKLDLPNTAENKKRVENALRALDMLFSTSAVAVDTTTYNPARVCKLYGTLAQKGTNTEERPHRYSRILQIPDEIKVNDVALLDKLEAVLPKPELEPQRNNLHSFDLGDWIARHDIPVKSVDTWGGGTKWVLQKCPFNPEHKGKDAAIIQTADGKICFHCFHNSCSDKKWRDFRVLYEPDAYDKQGQYESQHVAMPRVFDQNAPAPQNKYTQLSGVQSTATEWLWYPYIPSGKITLMTADPGTGKTFFSLYLSAMVSIGAPFFGQEQRRNPAVAIYQTAEDGIADTIKPRLEPMFPDFSNIYVIDESQESLTLSQPERIEQAMQDLKPALMIFDPLQAYLGADVDMHRANEVRPVLAEIGRLAEKYHCAIIFIMHNSKMGQNQALYRALGSIDIPAIARSMLILGKHPDDPLQKVVCHEKSSLAKHGESMMFHIDPHFGGVVFDGFTELKANDILSPHKGMREKPSVCKDEITGQLLDLLGEDGYAKLDDIKTLAAASGWSERTLYRVKSDLMLQSVNIGYSNSKSTWWLLPSVDKDAFRKQKQTEQINNQKPLDSDYERYYKPCS